MERYQGSSMFAMAKIAKREGAIRVLILKGSRKREPGKGNQEKGKRRLVDKSE